MERANASYKGSPPPEYLTVDEVATLTRLSRKTVYNLAWKREIPVLRVRRRLLFPRHEVVQWIENGGQMPSQGRVGLRPLPSQVALPRLRRER